MDEFPLDRPEIDGSLFSVEFGSAGRIHQLWLADPLHPDGEEFQFVAPIMPMGEELTEDYLPGSILIAARVSPDEPWISSRTYAATQKDSDWGVGFSYDFGILEELDAVGQFYEVLAPMPHLVWDIEIRNKSRRSIEIGELGFPFALNNILEGYGRTDEGVRELFHDRVHVHPFIGGAASYLHASRLVRRPPGLLITPGEGTQWEFYNSARPSLQSPFRWEGVPIVYAHSRATIEREEWPEWVNGHSAVILEPRETRKYQIRFYPTERDHPDPVGHALVLAGRPIVRLLPGAVVPADVGIALEVGGATPVRFSTDVDAELETDADDEGGFCFVKPGQAGPMTVAFTDTLDRTSQVHLVFTEPIEQLIFRRAQWITTNQVISTPGPWQCAIVPGDNRWMEAPAEPELGLFETPFGLMSSLSDALFLSEKNLRYPVPSEIVTLLSYVERFLEPRVVNVASGEVGSRMSAFGVAYSYGHAPIYPLAALLYFNLAELLSGPNGSNPLLKIGAFTAAARSKRAEEFVLTGLRISTTAARRIHPSVWLGTPLLLEAEVQKQLRQLEANDDEGEFGDLVRHLAARALELREARLEALAGRQYPFVGDSAFQLDGTAEVYTAAKATGNIELMERCRDILMAARSMGPSWWSYGTEMRWREQTEATPAMPDRARIAGGPATVANSVVLLDGLEFDEPEVPNAFLTAGFAGMLSPWVLVRPDGAGALGYTPDSSSQSFGAHWSAGDLGLSLSLYLRHATTYVVFSTQQSGIALGAHFEYENLGTREVITIRPWDGVGRRIWVRQLGLEIETTSGQIKEARFDTTKRNLTLRIGSPTLYGGSTDVVVRGLWGSRFLVDGKVVPGFDGRLSIRIELAAQSERLIEIEAI
jgi:hypothetical protein